jgi:hypothetical protein
MSEEGKGEESAELRLTAAKVWHGGRGKVIQGLIWGARGLLFLLAAPKP